MTVLSVAKKTAQLLLPMIARASASTPWLDCGNNNLAPRFARISDRSRTTGRGPPTLMTAGHGSLKRSSHAPILSGDSTPAGANFMIAAASARMSMTAPSMTGKRGVRRRGRSFLSCSSSQIGHRLSRQVRRLIEFGA